MSPNILTNISKECSATHWCFSWWHKVRYGSSRTENQVNEKMCVVEYFCNKCKKKTQGFTHFGPYEFKLTDKD